MNHSWNNGHEGPSDDPAIRARRATDLRALLGTLFGSTGTILLTAGDEFGRSQHGNNNAYAQDNAISWIDWAGRDRTLEDHVAALAAWRAAGGAGMATLPQRVGWLNLDGVPLTIGDWENPAAPGLILQSHDPLIPYRVSINRAAREVCCTK